MRFLLLLWCTILLQVFFDSFVLEEKFVLASVYLFLNVYVCLCSSTLRFEVSINTGITTLQNGKLGSVFGKVGGFDLSVYLDDVSLCSNPYTRFTKINPLSACFFCLLKSPEDARSKW